MFTSPTLKVTESRLMSGAALIPKVTVPVKFVPVAEEDSEMASALSDGAEASNPRTQMKRVEGENKRFIRVGANDVV